MNAASIYLALSQLPGYPNLAKSSFSLGPDGRAARHLRPFTDNAYCHIQLLRQNKASHTWGHTHKRFFITGMTLENIFGLARSVSDLRGPSSLLSGLTSVKSKRIKHWVVSEQGRRVLLLHSITEILSCDT